MEGVRFYLQRFGIGLRRMGPSFWLHAESQAAMETWAALVCGAVGQHPRYRLVVTAPGKELRQAASRIFPETPVLPPPPGNDVLLWRFLSKIHPHLLMVAPTARHLPDSVFARSRRYPFAVVALQDAAIFDPIHNVETRLLRNADRVIVLANIARDRIPDVAGLQHKLTILPQGSQADLTTCFSAAVTGTHNWDSAKPGARTSLSVRIVRTMLRTAPGKRILRKRGTKIASLEALKEELGHPQTILCLGNGPSSVAPELDSLHYDCLFRVNHRWINEGRRTKPDMIFTGDPTSVAAVPSAIVGFRTQQQEAQVMLRTLYRMRDRHIRYITMEGLPVTINEEEWSAQPTNGASMISLAAALRPAHLIIGGIDLYEHPEGIYPGDETTANMYMIVHSRDVELAIIRKALRDFKGKLTILSEPLRNRLQAMEVAS
jgi:hypothetical protein